MYINYDKMQIGVLLAAMNYAIKNGKRGNYVDLNI